MTTLVIELTREQAEGILRANDAAVGETTAAAVDEKLCKRIMATWPELRAEYGGAPGEFWQRADHFGSLATHEWVFAVETWEREPSAEYPHPKRDVYAAPEIAGAPLGEPFVTAIAKGSDLTVLFPKSAPGALRAACMRALQASDIKHRVLDSHQLQNACAVAINEWRKLMGTGEVWHDGILNEWRHEPAGD